MTGANLPADDDADIDLGHVQQMVARQFPRWHDLPLRRIPSPGVDNTVYRLGSEMAVRLPRSGDAAGRLLKEAKWLPRLAPILPMPVSVPVAFGQPDGSFPHPWAVCQWVEGEDAFVTPVDDLEDAAKALARFIAALQAVDVADGPAAGHHNHFRGCPLAIRDEYVRAAIPGLAGIVDTEAAMIAWAEALATPEWDRPGVWMHGDLHPTNLIVAGGKFSGVVDFGYLAVGDPACEMLSAWLMLDRSSRQTFRAILDVDDATWARGRGWALSFAIIAHPYYKGTALAVMAERAIAEILAGDR